MPNFTKAHQRYRTKDSTIVPGVTTILNLLNKPALVPWAWKLGMQGLDYRKVVGQAASIGTIAHYLVECYLKGEEPELEEYSPADLAQATLAAQGFVEWWEVQGLKVVGSEVMLVSERWRYGGSLDIVCEKVSTGKLWLLDIKTSKGIYDEMRYQLAAYWRLWDENQAPENKTFMKGRLITEAHIIQLDKETGTPHFHPMGTTLDTEWEIFQHLRAIYSLQKQVDPKRRNEFNTAAPALKRFSPTRD